MRDYGLKLHNIVSKLFMSKKLFLYYIHFITNFTTILLILIKHYNQFFAFSQTLQYNILIHFQKNYYYSKFARNLNILVLKATL